MHSEGLESAEGKGSNSGPHHHTHSTKKKESTVGVACPHGAIRSPPSSPPLHVTGQMPLCVRVSQCDKNTNTQRAEHRRGSVWVLVVVAAAAREKRYPAAGVPLRTRPSASAHRKRNIPPPNKRGGEENQSKNTKEIAFRQTTTPAASSFLHPQHLAHTHTHIRKKKMKKVGWVRRRGNTHTHRGRERERGSQSTTQKNKTEQHVVT